MRQQLKQVNYSHDDMNQLYVIHMLFVQGHSCFI